MEAGSTYSSLTNLSLPFLPLVVSCSAAVSGTLITTMQSVIAFTTAVQVEVLRHDIPAPTQIIFVGQLPIKITTGRTLRLIVFFSTFFPFVKDTIIKTFLTISGTSYLFTRVSGW